MFSDNFRRGEGKTKRMAGSKAVSKMADIGWKAFQAVNSIVPEGESIQPAWAAEPLLKSYERTAPPLGFPRETDSLCPACVKQVRNGVINRQSRVRVVREGVEVYEGTISSLKRFKDDVREVKEGFECGIGIENFNDLKVNDVIECYKTEQVARTLEASGGQ